MTLIDLPIDDLSDLDALLDQLSDEGGDMLTPLSQQTFPDIATHLRLWQLCRRSACRQAKRCCGDQTDCCRRHEASIPPHVRAWFVDMGEACREQAFEDALGDVDIELTTAAGAWCAALRAVDAFAAHGGESRRRPSPSLFARLPRRLPR